jgi:acyl-CoA synthetase (AMP-forming)/AMP-acid ligase II
MLGYWRQGEATADVVGAGELRTGDVGFLDGDGYLHVRDRRRLMIIRGGANVYPAEVERVLIAAPGVRGCAVTGVPDDRLGERVVAVVELESGSDLDEDEVRAHCMANLAAYKVPERFRVVPRLPRNAMGKVVRQGLPELF